MNLEPNPKPVPLFDSGDLNQIIMHINMDPCRCVPFLGAGVNAESLEYPEYEGLLLGGGLASEFLKIPNFNYQGPESQHGNLAKVTLQFEMRTSRTNLIQMLKGLIPDDDRQPSPLLRTLAKLKLRLIVTTNYDRLMELALKLEGKVEGKDFITIVQPPSGWDIRKFPQLLDQFDKWAEFEGLLLYKIHGSFNGPASRKPLAPLAPKDPPKSPLIITEEDYIEFMTAMGARDGERVGVPDCIRDRMQRNMLLFLGYGLEDWDIRAIYKGLIDSLDKDDKRESFAIQKEPNELWKRFWSHRSVNVKEFNLYKFATEFHLAYFGKPLEWPPLPTALPAQAAGAA